MNKTTASSATVPPKFEEHYDYPRGSKEEINVLLKYRVIQRLKNGTLKCDLKYSPQREARLYKTLEHFDITHPEERFDTISFHLVKLAGQALSDSEEKTILQKK